MAITQAQLDNFLEHLLRGEKKVTYADKTVEYNSLAEMREQYEYLKSQLPTAVKKSYAKYKDGL